MDSKPRIGVLFLTSSWFREVGIQQINSPLTEEVEKIADEIVERVSDFIDPLYEGIVCSQEAAEEAGKKMLSLDPDGLIVSPLMWCEDQILITALRNIKHLPMILCTFFPFESLGDYMQFHEMLMGSGSVGTLQMSGYLNRDGYEYQAVSGYYRDDSLYSEIKEHCNAMAIKKMLLAARCGVLPFRCEQMTTTYVDEFDIRKLYGIELKYLELQAIKEEAQIVTNDEIKELKKLLLHEGVIFEVDQRNMEEGIRYAVALEKVVTKQKLSILAMNDVIEETHRCFGLRPCLCNPRLSEKDIVIAMEADIAAGIAMYILRLFTEGVPFYTEIFTADLEQNAILMGHAGYHDYRCRDMDYPVKIVPDVEYKNSDPFTGACTYFKYGSGPVTLVNSVYSEGRIRWIVVEGISLSGPPKLEGNSHLFCRLAMPLKEFYNKTLEIGVSQHWIVVHGYHAGSLRHLCRWINIDCVYL